MVQIQCKNCKRAADSSTFVIDPIIGKLVCPQCVKDRKTGKMSSTSSTQTTTASQSVRIQPQEIKPQMQAGAQVKSQTQQPSTLADLTSMMLKKNSNANSGVQPSKPAFNPFAKPAQAAAPQAKPQMQTSAGQTRPQTQPSAPSKPKSNVPGWDADDEALERTAPKFDSRQPAPKLDANHVQLTCSKCQYKIKYDVVKEQPRACPYCGREVDTSEVRF
ncbi:MAG: hypothetical protein WC755_02420 [Candidatus Woesearchaeota archaeon]|jgi:hypothetical protein